MFVASLEATSGSEAKKKKDRVTGSDIKNICEKISSEETLKNVLILKVLF